MTLNEIAVKTKAILTPEDLLCLINEIRQSEDQVKHKDLQLKDLALYCNPNSRKVKRYRTFYIPKKSGGKREICAPVSKLGAFLWPLDMILKSLYEPKSCVMGFTYGRSIVDNAKTHIGQIYILNLDLHDFFPSIKQARVWKRLQLAPFSFPEDVASVIAGLCSCKKVKEDGTNDFVLPQGAPTSPVLTNLICEKLDRRLMGVAKRFNLRYTRYADDITFSSMHSVLSVGGAAYMEIVRIIEEQGFAVNEKKTRLQKVGARQEVTGLILSEKINTPRAYVRGIDQILYVWEKFGYEKAYARLLQEEGKKAYHKKGVPTLENVIGGKLDYLKMVKGKNDKVYTKYASKFEKLKKSRNNPSDGLIYIATYTVGVFQSLFNTELNISVIQGKAQASFLLNETFYPVRMTSASKQAIFQKEKEISAFHISLCKDGDLFWLLHISKPAKPKTLEITLSIKKIIEIWEKDGLSAAIEAEIKNQKANKKKKVPKALSSFSVMPPGGSVPNTDNYGTAAQKEKGITSNNPILISSVPINEEDLISSASVFFSDGTTDAELLLKMIEKDGEEQ